MPVPVLFIVQHHFFLHTGLIYMLRRCHIAGNSLSVSDGEVPPSARNHAGWPAPHEQDPAGEGRRFTSGRSKE